MTTEGKDEASGMELEDDKSLWSLLSQHEPPVKVSPYFARRVLREIAFDEPARGDRSGWWRGLWDAVPRHAALWSGAVAFGMLCLSAVLTIPANHPSVMRVRPVEEASEANPVKAVAPSQEDAPQASSVPVQDEEVIADLDDLLSREESRLWTEDTDTARF